MNANEFHDMIETLTPDGTLLPLVRRGHLVPTQPRGARPKSQATPIRYELKTGEPVEQLGASVWLHPLTGEWLQLAVYGASR